MQSAKTPRQPRVQRVGPDDTLVQKRPKTPRNVDLDHANQVPDQNWELGTAEDRLEGAAVKR